jgi:hypothetical protein
MNGNASYILCKYIIPTPPGPCSVDVFACTKDDGELRCQHYFVPQMIRSCDHNANGTFAFTGRMEFP